MAQGAYVQYGGKQIGHYVNPSALLLNIKVNINESISEMPDGVRLAALRAVNTIFNKRDNIELLFSIGQVSTFCGRFPNKNRQRG